MITGAHLLFYSPDADADRAFLRDVLGWPHVDVGHGWLIFKVPPAEAAVHPAEHHLGGAGDGLAGAVLYLMCDDLARTMASLQEKGVTFSAIENAPWGTVTTFALPSRGRIGLYEPKHPTATSMRP